MKLENISKSELESMNYDDIAFIILSEEKKQMKLNVLFKKICDALEYDDSVYEAQITDFFEIMSTDKRFTMLEDGSWDLRINHTQEIILDEDVEDDEEVEDEDLLDDLEDEEDEEDIFYDDTNEDDQGEDDLKDLVILDDEETNE